MTIDLFRRYGNLLRSDGTNQLQRLLPGLEPDYIVPDERTLSDLVDYAYRVAAEVRYYDLSGQATGDWRALFETLLIPGTDRIRPTGDLQVLLASRDDWPPHLVLFLVFLKLFQFLQGDLNGLTQRHLLHYYENELGLQRRAAANDEVHVIFELAQNAAATLLPAGTLLDAGKDALGRALMYATQNEVVVNRASIDDLRRLVVETDRHHNQRFFVAGKFGAGETPGGYTFGRRQLGLDVGQRFMSEAKLGFIVAAPILKMVEGNRRVVLRAHLRPGVGTNPVVTQGITSGLEITFSGADGWLAPDSFNATLLSNGGLGMPALLLTVTVGSVAPAIVPVNPALHGEGLAGARAALRCLVKGDSGLYEVLNGFTVDRIELAVDVRGVRKLVVQNDESVLESGKPLPLFGSQPKIGSAFYVGSAEVFGKQLTGLDIHFEWKSPPDDLFDHYRGYFDNVDSDLTDTFYTFFRADVDLLYEREFRPFLFSQGLFQSTPGAPNTISANESAFTSALAGLGAQEHPDLADPEAFDGTSRFGFVRMRLRNPTRTDTGAYAVDVPFEAFGHGNFATRYTVQAIALSQWALPATKPLLPKEPYTPVLSSLSLDYRATAQVRPGAVGADSGGGSDDANAQCFVVEPFGVRRVRSPADARLVPHIDASAALFLGIGALAAPANVALYFEIDVGTATGAEVLNAGDTSWSVLDADDHWRPLDSAAILIDGTEGFQKPGVIAISLPREASLVHRSMPAGLLWLRAVIDKPPESAARTLSLRTQAVLAKFEPGVLPLATYEDHLQSSLPGGSIVKLVTRNASIKRIEQPDPSFGGRGEEDVTAFVRRASERLRHRHRAVTAWDFERLVLERFPEVFKVKCLPHTDESGAFLAGHTALVVVPNLRRGGGTNPLEPRAGEVLLAEIRDDLAGLATPFAVLHVIRPVFERLRVEAKVVFARGRDPGYYAGVLNTDLRRFLSPWAYQDGEDILFGSRIYRSDILAFIEGRDYVDHLIGLRLFHHFAGEAHEGIGWMRINIDFTVRPKPQPSIPGMRIGDDFIVGRPVEFAETTQAHAILVSHPEHLITPVAAGAEICSGVTRLGIGYMTVGLDFDVALEAAA